MMPQSQLIFDKSVYDLYPYKEKLFYHKQAKAKLWPRNISLCLFGFCLWYFVVAFISLSYMLLFMLCYCFASFRLLEPFLFPLLDLFASLTFIAGLLSVIGSLFWIWAAFVVAWMLFWCCLCRLVFLLVQLACCCAAGLDCRVAAHYAGWWLGPFDRLVSLMVCCRRLFLQLFCFVLGSLFTLGSPFWVCCCWCWLGWLMLVFWEVSGPSYLDAAFGCFLFGYVGACSLGLMVFYFAYMGVVHASVYGILSFSQIG